MWEPCSRRCASEAQAVIVPRELVMVHLQQQEQLCARVRRTDEGVPGTIHLISGQVKH